MIIFWIAAALLSAAAGALVLARSARPDSVRAEDPEVEIGRRALAEVDALKARGLLDEEGWAAARAEAGRRLLRAQDRAAAATSEPEPASRSDRALVLGAAAAAALAAGGIYLAVGAHGRADEPYARRLKAWTADPRRLDWPQMSAVVKQLAARHPRDPRAWSFLGLAYLRAGDPADSVEALQKAVQLAPADAQSWSLLGQALTQLGEGKVGDDAQAAFAKAQTLDPSLVEPRLYLGKAALDAGRKEEGIGLWRSAIAAMAADDPRREAVTAQIEAAVSGRTDAAQAIAAAKPADQAALIRGMVDRLAARLESAPDDAPGWARLIRAYGVLGDKPAQAKALDRARAQFKGRPQDLAAIEAAANSPPP